MNIIFIGAPGSGKGTQSRLFIDNFKFVQLSTGDILRSAIKAGTDTGKQAKSLMDAGKLVPDEIMISLVNGFISNQHGKSVILDGFPRTVSQAESLEKIMLSMKDSISNVLYFKINPQVLIERLTGRRTCSGCGEIYHIITKSTKIDGKCDKCGSPVVQRPDDRAEVILERLEQFEKNTGPTVEYYRQKGVLSVVDGSNDPSVVYEQIKGYLGL